MKKFKIIFLFLGFRILLFGAFTIYALYSQLKTLTNKNDQTKPPIIYELNFENKKITSNISKFYDGKNNNIQGDIIVGISITGIDINNIQGIRWFIKDVNNGEIYRSEYSNGFENIKYFFISNFPQELVLDAEIEYYNKKVIKSSNYFSGPIVTVRENMYMPDIPLVGLKIDRKFAKVGDIIKFEAIAKVLSEDKNFDANVVFKFDFDGDNIWDITTGNRFVQYIYTGGNKYSPRVAALYKGYKGIANNIIFVEDIAKKEEIIINDSVNIPKIGNPVMRAQGGTQYDLAKKDILSILPLNLKIDIEQLFEQFESDKFSNSTINPYPDNSAKILQEIIDMIKKNTVKSKTYTDINQITQLDMTNIVMPNICIIYDFYSILNNICLK